MAVTCISVSSIHVQTIYVRHPLFCSVPVPLLSQRIRKSARRAPRLVLHLLPHPGRLGSAAHRHGSTYILIRPPLAAISRHPYSTGTQRLRPSVRRTYLPSHLLCKQGRRTRCSMICYRASGSTPHSSLHRPVAGPRRPSPCSGSHGPDTFDSSSASRQYLLSSRSAVDQRLP